MCRIIHPSYGKLPTFMNIIERVENIAEMNRKLSDMIDAQEGTEWRTRHLEVTCDC